MTMAIYKFYGEENLSATALVVRQFLFLFLLLSLLISPGCRQLLKKGKEGIVGGRPGGRPFIYRTNTRPPGVCECIYQIISRKNAERSFHLNGSIGTIHLIINF